MDGVNNPATLDSARQDDTAQKTVGNNSCWNKSPWADKPGFPEKSPRPMTSGRISIQLETDATCLVTVEPVIALFAPHLRSATAQSSTVRISTDEARALYETLDAMFGGFSQARSLSALTEKLARKFLPRRLPQSPLIRAHSNTPFWLKPSPSSTPKPETIAPEASAESAGVNHVLDFLYPPIPEFVRPQQVFGVTWREEAERPESGAGKEEPDYSPLERERPSAPYDVISPVEGLETAEIENERMPGITLDIDLPQQEVEVIASDTYLPDISLREKIQGCLAEAFAERERSCADETPPVESQSAEAELPPVDSPVDSKALITESAEYIGETGDGAPISQVAQNDRPMPLNTSSAEELLMISPDSLTAIVRQTRSAWKNGLEPQNTSAAKNGQSSTLAQKAAVDKVASGPNNPVEKLDETKLHMIRTVQLNSTLINYFANRYFSTNEPI